VLLTFSRSALSELFSLLVSLIAVLFWMIHRIDFVNPDSNQGVKNLFFTEFREVQQSGAMSIEKLGPITVL
jgi:hypothetical protein